MYCSKCGANISDTAAFCPSCGQATGAPQAPAGTASAPPISGPVTAPGWAVRPTVRYAGFWLRFVAFIIDWIVLGFIAAIVTVPLAAGFRHGRPPMSPEELAPYFAGSSGLFGVSLVIDWLYYALFESSVWQATLGKKALGLEVTDMQGARINFARATGRFFAKFLSGIIVLIGFFMIGFTERKQGLHDIIAGTLVIRKV
jgi:uncharacterized RDD family membrane protein YckC